MASPASRNTVVMYHKDGDGYCAGAVARSAGYGDCLAATLSSGTV